MQIFVRSLDGTTVAVDVAFSSCAGEVSQMIGQADGMALTFGGKILDAAEPLMSTGIQDGSTVFVTTTLLGGGDGTPAMGKRHKKTHMLCARCGKRSFHVQKKRCASCGFPDKKMRGYHWSIKANRRRAPGTGRMKHLRHMPRRFKNGFREGTTPPPRKKNSDGSK